MRTLLYAPPCPAGAVVLMTKLIAIVALGAILWWGLAIFLSRPGREVSSSVSGQLFKGGMLFAAFCVGAVVVAVLALLALPLGLFFGTFGHE